MSDSAKTYCMELVREHDKDRFLASLYAPSELQGGLFSLYAFRHEIARIRFAVSDAQLGEIRLQWWRDTLASLHEPQAHPVAAALAETIRQHNLPITPLHALIDAHAFDLYADIMPSLTSLEAYLGETQAAVFQLASLIVSPAQANPELSGYAGVAYGLAILLNGFRSNVKFLPSDCTAEQAAGLARRRLQQSRAQQLSSNLLPVFLPVTTTELYLRRMDTPVPAWRRQWAIWRSARREKL
jgi:15-cis-phytoene synthase